MLGLSALNTVRKYISSFPKVHPDADRFLDQLVKGRIKSGTSFIIGIREPDGTLRQTEFEMDENDVKFIEALRKVL